MMISYPHYKEARLDWLNKIPSHWNELRAKYIFRHVDERSQTGEEELLSVSHITGVTPRSEKNVTMFMAESYVGHKLCQPGDLVINSLWAWMAALGISNYTGIVSSAYGVYRLLQPDRFVPKYLDYLLRTKGYAGEYLCRSKGIWTSRLLLTPESFLDIPVIIPPVAEQKVIVAFLDGKVGEIDAFVARKRQLIGLLQEQKQAVINRAVTQGLDPHAPRKPSGLPWLGDIPAHWQEKKLKYVVALQTGFTLGQNYSGQTLNGYPYLRVANVQSGYLDLTDVTTVQIPADKADRHRLQNGDVVLTEGGDFDKLGRGYVWEGQIENCLHQNHIFALRPNKMILTPYYLAAVMASSYGNLYFIYTSKQTTNLATTNSTTLKNFPLLIPPLKEQEMILDSIRQETFQIDQAMGQAEQEIELIEAYRTSLIAHAVTGKIDVHSV